MQSDAATYQVLQPFDAVVRTLRRELAEAGMNTIQELNVAERIRQRFSIGMSPCLILFVSATGLAEKAPGLAPLQIVVTDRGEASEIHVLRVPESVI